MLRYFGAFLLAAIMTVGTSLPAAADGHFHHFRGHSHVVVGLGFGPLFYRPYYYSPYYYPPPVYYAPPPYYYYGPSYWGPGPYYYPPAPVVAAPRPTIRCRVFRGDGTDDDTGQPFYGTACLESDGRWHIVGD